MTKHYTFTLTCSFTMQFTFDESLVEEIDDGELEPTDDALASVANEIAEQLGKNYVVNNVDVDADILLGED